MGAPARCNDDFFKVTPFLTFAFKDVYNRINVKHNRMYIVGWKAINGCLPKHGNKRRQNCDKFFSLFEPNQL